MFSQGFPENIQKSYSRRIPCDDAPYFIEEHLWSVSDKAALKLPMLEKQTFPQSNFCHKNIITTAHIGQHIFFVLKIFLFTCLHVLTS